MKKYRYLILFLLTVFVSCKPLVYTAPDISEQEQDRIKDMIAQVDGARMLNFLELIEGPRHVIAAEEAGIPIETYQNEITGLLDSWGYVPELQEVTIETFFYYDHNAADGPVGYEADGPRKMNNIIAYLPGTNPQLAPVYMSCHWDTVYSTPGYNDNGSGVAALLEAAQIFRNESFSRSVYFCFFAFEEQNLIGSSYYAEQMEVLPEIVYNVDMIGFTSTREIPPPGFSDFIGMPETGDFIGIFASPGTQNEAFEMASVIELFVPELKYYLLILDENINNNLVLFSTFRSDHLPFWERGVKALFLTDTAELREGSPYHTSGDTKNSLDPDFLVNNTKALLAAAALQAELIIP